jgi:DNA-binding PadR family transcriptional regulator
VIAQCYFTIGVLKCTVSFPIRPAAGHIPGDTAIAGMNGVPPTPGPAFGPRGPRGRGRRARRGDIRTAALLLLAEEPRNGYQIMQEVEERSQGAWNPSPGSVYPALAQLEDEGLIAIGEEDGRKLYELTDAGRKALEERGERPAPWEQMSGEFTPVVHDLVKQARDVRFAFAQIIRTGSEAQIQSARDVLAQTRRDLYGILADGDDADATVGED